MTDSLKTRVSRVIAGSVHALIDRIEDQAPEAMMEQSIRDADSVIDDVRHELGTTSANRHLAQQQHAALNKQHESLAAQTDHALQQDREDLARTAVARQLDIEAQLPVLESTLSEYARQEGELTGYVGALLAKRREMETALGEFRKSRAAAASVAGHAASGATANSPTEGRIDSATNAFNRVYQRQTGLDGAARVSNLAQGAKLQELEELTREHKIAERIARLKADKP